jgi:hypothetical protein
LLEEVLKVELQVLPLLLVLVLLELTVLMVRSSRTSVKVEVGEREE